MRFTIRAVGQLKAGPEKDLLEQYHKRLQWNVSVQECKEGELLKNISSHVVGIALDEHGKPWSSLELAEKIRDMQNQSVKEVVIFIGGADGLPQEVLGFAKHKLALGRLTWPHMLVRALIMEQLYRAQQVLAGHPYHRE